MMLLFFFLNFFFIKIPTIDVDNLQKNFRGEKGGKGEYLYTANFLNENWNLKEQAALHDALQSLYDLIIASTLTA